MSLSFEQLMTRFLKTGYDSHVFDTFVRIGLPDEDVRREEELYCGTRPKDIRWKLLERQANRLRKSRLKKYRDREVDDIIREEIVKTVEERPRIRNELFGHTDSERKMYRVIRSYLRQLKRGGTYDDVYETYDRRDLPVGNPDFVALKKTFLGRPSLVAIDAKAKLQSLHSFYHQASRYREGFDEVFLATTNWLAIQEGKERLLGMLNGLDVGLMYVDMTSEQCERASDSGKSHPDREKKKVILSLLGWD